LRRGENGECISHSRLKRFLAASDQSYGKIARELDGPCHINPIDVVNLSAGNLYFQTGALDVMEVTLDGQRPCRQIERWQVCRAARRDEAGVVNVASHQASAA
jgi:hypothetical protein